MYSYIKGIIVDMARDHIVVDNQGIGYLIYEYIDDKSEIKKYETAQIIEDNKEKLDYLVNTKFGNVLISSTFI